MKVVSWNTNGLKSCLQKSGFDFFKGTDIDVFCLQEIKTKEQPTVLEGYHHYWNSDKRNNMYGVATLSKQEPLSVKNGIGIERLDEESRLLTLEFQSCFIVNAYYPNANSGAKHKLDRQMFRLDWDKEIQHYMNLLRKSKPVILCGDFNVARLEIDVFPENTKQRNTYKGYISEEREDLENLLESGFVDAFRYLYPEKENAYTWWSNRLQKRETNQGWRLDYFCVDTTLTGQIQEVQHLTEIRGSDHCPIELEVSMNL